MWERLKDLVFITEPKFGFEKYRKPIVWFDKLLVVGGILAGIAGRLLAAVWVIRFVLDDAGPAPAPAFLVAGVLIWTAGEYFLRTGHRGLIYHHTDLLVDYLDQKLAGPGVSSRD